MNIHAPAFDYCNWLSAYRHHEPLNGTQVYVYLSEKPQGAAQNAYERFIGTAKYETVAQLQADLETAGWKRKRKGRKKGELGIWTR